MWYLEKPVLIALIHSTLLSGKQQVTCISRHLGVRKRVVVYILRCVLMISIFYCSEKTMSTRFLERSCNIVTYWLQIHLIVCMFQKLYNFVAAIIKENVNWE